MHFSLNSPKTENFHKGMLLQCDCLVTQLLTSQLSRKTSFPSVVASLYRLSGKEHAREKSTFTFKVFSCGLEDKPFTLIRLIWFIVDFNLTGHVFRGFKENLQFIAFIIVFSRRRHLGMLSLKGF